VSRRWVALGVKPAMPRSRPRDTRTGSTRGAPAGRWGVRLREALDDRTAAGGRTLSTRCQERRVKQLYVNLTPFVTPFVPDDIKTARMFGRHFAETLHRVNCAGTRREAA